MYRIRLTNGEEAVFRSVEELSLGIASGVIAPDAEIYHKKSRSWQPIRSHPDYQAAVEQRPVALEAPEATRDPASGRPAEPARAPEVVISPEGIPEIVMSAGGISPEDAPTVDVSPEASSIELPPTELPPTDPSQLLLPAPVLQMESRSGRELLLRRKNATPLAIAAAGFAAVVVFIALLLYPRPTPPIPEATKPPNIGATHPQPLPLTPNPAPPTTVESLAASPAESVKVTGPPVPTPEELAARRDLARDHQITALDQGFTKFAFIHLFSPSRLAAVDSVRLTRRAIGPLRTMLTQYRSAIAQIDLTYQDSAERLGASGVWPVGALTNWKAKGPAGEDKEEVAQSDSLLGAIDRLFGLLVEEEGKYNNSEESISFNDVTAAADYDGIRNLIAHLAAIDSTIPSHAPLARLAAAATPPPPVVLPRGSSLPATDTTAH
jgi:hypothetical protein